MKKRTKIDYLNYIYKHFQKNKHNRRIDEKNYGLVLEKVGLNGQQICQLSRVKLKLFSTEWNKYHSTQLVIVTI